MNFLKLLFGLMTANIILPGVLVSFFEKFIPESIVVLFRYGKTAKKHSLRQVKRIEIPKSRFRHFYVFATVLNTYILLDLINVFYYKNLPSSIITGLLDISVGSKRLASFTPVQLLLAQVVMSIQSWKRLYEVYYVSVFSDRAKINYFHYIVGYVHYWGTAMAILSEAPGYSSGYHTFSLRKLTLLDSLAFFLAIYAIYKQLESHKILAGLRRDCTGKVVSQHYQIPHGGWFEYVSSPHQFAEILLYSSLTILLRNSCTWFYVCFWVLSNQISTAYLSHRWYQNEFSEYPTNRKILIPFIF